MAQAKSWDLLIKNVRVVRPHGNAVHEADIAIRGGRFAKVAPSIPVKEAKKTYDGKGRLAFPGACCRRETKAAKKYFGNIWLAKSGFGGTQYLLPALVSEGTKRGMSYGHMARLTSWNPARRFGLNSKGDIAEGLDADLALLEPRESWTIRARDSESTQGYTPFEGLELSSKVTATFLRGELICERGNVLGKPRGRYLHRPTVI